MSYTRLLLFLLIFAAFSGSCRKEQFTDDPSADLSFSTDTLHFDTVFVTVGSATRNFKVRNENSNAVRISHIRLAGGEQSPFRINVDGRAGTHITEYELSGEDSMYIFVEVTIDPNNINLPFIVLDSILFETNGNQQKIILAAYGQNAHFYHDSVICNETWINDLPHVIYGYVGVAEGCKLTIEQGVKIYSHRGSGILAAGSIEVNGTKENPVIFQGDRLEQSYAKEPGQWYGIRFLPKSNNNIFTHAIIQNAVVGIEVDSLPTPPNDYNLTLEKTIIRRMSLAGLVGYTAHINAKNLLMYTCGQSIFVGALGGKYTFTNCTFDNSQSIVTKRDPSIWLTNTNYEDKERGINLKNDLTAEFRNCIIWGNLEDEMELVKDGQGSFNTLFERNIVKATEVKIEGENKINEFPRFVNAGGEDYALDHNSPAINYGIKYTGDYEVLDDINNDMRDSEPDAGAYERK